MLSHKRSSLSADTPMAHHPAIKNMAVNTHFFVNVTYKKTLSCTGKIVRYMLLASLALAGCQTQPPSTNKQANNAPENLTTQQQAQGQTRSPARSKTAEKKPQGKRSENTKTGLSAAQKARPENQATATKKPEQKTASSLTTATPTLPVKSSRVMTQNTKAVQNIPTKKSAITPVKTGTKLIESQNALAVLTPNTQPSIQAKIELNQKPNQKPSTQTSTPNGATTTPPLSTPKAKTVNTSLPPQTNSKNGEQTALEKLTLSLQNLPQRIDDTWSIDLKQAGKPTAHCVLLSEPQTLNDSQGMTTFKVMLDAAKIRFQTASNIDLSYPNTGVVISGKTTQRIGLDGLERDTTAIINKDMPTVLAALREANQMDVYLGFWPTWPMTETKRISIAINNFAQAEATLSACNKLISGE